VQNFKVESQEASSGVPNWIEASPAAK
jgi:hypothetical protein